MAKPEFEGLWNQEAKPFRIPKDVDYSTMKPILGSKMDKVKISHDITFFSFSSSLLKPCLVKAGDAKSHTKHFFFLGSKRIDEMMVCSSISEGS